MQITVELPEDIAGHDEPGREALEALVLQGYRSRKLTQFDVGRLLGLSRIQADDFLARHVNLYDYSTEELESEADLFTSAASPIDAPAHLSAVTVFKNCYTFVSRTTRIIAACHACI